LAKLRQGIDEPSLLFRPPTAKIVNVFHDFPFFKETAVETVLVPSDLVSQ
jgi:hypothetical protein